MGAADSSAGQLSSGRLPGQLPHTVLCCTCALMLLLLLQPFLPCALTSPMNAFSNPGFTLAHTCRAPRRVATPRCCAAAVTLRCTHGHGGSERESLQGHAWHKRAGRDCKEAW
jgi:hypothetical protein